MNAISPPAPDIPTAHHVAIAVVTACRLTGEDPLDVATGGAKRGRMYAVRGLKLAFPHAGWPVLARLFDHNPKTLQPCLQAYERKKWWDEHALDEVVGALVADRIEPCEESRAKADDDDPVAETERSAGEESVSRPASGRSDAATSERMDVTGGESAAPSFCASVFDCKPVALFSETDEIATRSRVRCTVCGRVWKRRAVLGGAA